MGGLAAGFSFVPVRAFLFRMQLLLATRNDDKVNEIRAVLRAPRLTLRSALDAPDLPDVEEDGETLEANALKKARVLALHGRCWTLADDTGLEVDALGGAPGVRSARFAGPRATSAANVAKLLAELEGATCRRARFRTVIALSDPLGHTAWVEGVCEGEITSAPVGKFGFGYDPVFRPNGESRTFAEMPMNTKNRISHRARALEQARAAWSELLGSDPPVLPEALRRT